MLRSKQGFWATVICFSLTVLVSDRALSAPQAPSADPFTAVERAAPLDLANLVDRLGDNAVIERLEPAVPVEIQLVAVRAAPWMKAPESVLPRLVTLVEGRDSELAPEAARAAAQIANVLDSYEIQTREIAVDELATVRERLALAGTNELLRADIRLYAVQAAASLR
jgi:hypothetical protein